MIFLDVAYESHTSPDQVIDIPDHFKQKREFPGVLIQGVGNVHGMFCKLYYAMIVVLKIRHVYLRSG